MDDEDIEGCGDRTGVRVAFTVLCVVGGGTGVMERDCELCDRFLDCVGPCAGTDAEAVLTLAAVVCGIDFPFI